MGKATSPCFFVGSQSQFPCQRPVVHLPRLCPGSLLSVSQSPITPFIRSMSTRRDPNRKRLRDSGFEAYIVGGAVRDFILGGQPKDFDVATNAKPEEIKGLFRRSRIIGRRFQIVHVRDGREVEVTTYRGPHDSEDSLKNASKRSDKGLLLRDNVYGTLEQDAARRDLTINALYYDPLDETVLDQIDGGRDISARLIRLSVIR